MDKIPLLDMTPVDAKRVQGKINKNTSTGGVVYIRTRQRNGIESLINREEELDWAWYFTARAQGG